MEITPFKNNKENILRYFQEFFFDSKSHFLCIETMIYELSILVLSHADNSEIYKIGKHHKRYIERVAFETIVNKLFDFPKTINDIKIK